MSKIHFDISMSLDGYVAGPNDGIGNGLGDEGERLHEWVVRLRSWHEAHGYEGGAEGPENDLMSRAARAGAIILGRRMYENAEGWGDSPPFQAPAFVLTSGEQRRHECDNGASFTFLADAEAALSLAREAAGEKDVAIAGGARTIRTFIELGAVDEFTIHLAPVLLGGGVALFEGLGPEALGFHPASVLQGREAVHVDYEVRTEAAE